MLRVGMTTRQPGDGGGDGTSSDTPEGERDNGTFSNRSAAEEAIGHRADEAFVTMVISDSFAIGAEVMLHSLRDHSRVRRPHVVLVTSDVSEEKREMLKAAADEIVEVRRRNLLSKIRTQ